MSEEITLKIVLDHIQGLRGEMHTGFRAMKSEFLILKSDFKELKENMERIERNFSANIETLDGRLDAKARRICGALKSRQDCLS